MTQLARTAEDFDTLPDGAFIIAIERLFHDRPDRVNRTLWFKFGRGWVTMDPTDRNDGEGIESGGYLANLLTGFGRRDCPAGVAVVLGAGEPIGFDVVGDLPVHSVIRVGDDDVFVYNGENAWTLMDSSDPYDGRYGTPTASLNAYGSTCVVLYRPGDEGAPDPLPEVVVTETPTPAPAPEPVPVENTEADEKLRTAIAHALHADDVVNGRAHSDFEHMNEDACGWYFDNANAIIRALPALGLQRSTTG